MDQPHNVTTHESRPLCSTKMNENISNSAILIPKVSTADSLPQPRTDHLRDLPINISIIIISDE